MARARELLAGGVTEESLNAVGRLLAELSREPGFIPQAEMKSLHGGDTTSAVLQTDPDGLTLMFGKFSPQEETPVHDHNSWGVACVVFLNACSSSTHLHGQGIKLSAASREDDDHGLVSHK